MKRRNFIIHSAGLLTAASIAGYSVFDYLHPDCQINIHFPGQKNGHKMKNGDFPKIESEHFCDVLILGSGGAGLSAAWYLNKKSFRNFILVDGFEKNGNNSAFVYENLRAPSAAHYLAIPSLESEYVRQMLYDFDILKNNTFSENDLVFAPMERLFYKKKWQDGLLPDLDHDARKFFSFINKLKNLHDKTGNKIFAIPIYLSSADNQYRQLDQITFYQWLKNNGYKSKTLLWYLDYCCRDDYGRGIKQISAFAGLHYFAARNQDLDAVLTWNDGLAHISELIRNKIKFTEVKELPEKFHNQKNPLNINAAALSVIEKDNEVEVILHNLNNNTAAKVHAEKVICAMPIMVAKHVVTNFAKYAEVDEIKLTYAPWIIANFVLKKLPAERPDIGLAWDNVIYPSDSLGYVYSNNQEISQLAGKVIFTAYNALNNLSPIEMRKRMFHMSKNEFLYQSAKDLLKVYGNQFWYYCEYIDIAVRGHAMISPTCGYLNNKALHNLAENNSRVLFAHSDLAGYSVFEEANYFGVKAAKRVLDYFDL